MKNTTIYCFYDSAYQNYEKIKIYFKDYKYFWSLPEGVRSEGVRSKKLEEEFNKFIKDKIWNGEEWIRKEDCIYCKNLKDKNGSIEVPLHKTKLKEKENFKYIEIGPNLEEVILGIVVAIRDCKNSYDKTERLNIFLNSNFVREVFQDKKSFEAGKNFIIHKIKTEIGWDENFQKILCDKEKLFEEKK